MIDRYTTPEMSSLWSERTKMAAWLEVELAVCAVRHERGEIPDDAYAEIADKADFSVERVREIEETTRHDVIAFLTDVAENVGPASKYVHFGMTSSDVLDTGLALQLVRAGGLLVEEVARLGKALTRRSLEHRGTVMMGRTHGVHAEPITFGMVLALWALEVKRGLIRLERALEEVSVGKISGAVGTYASLDPGLEERVLERLGLSAEPISTQVVQRDRHAAFLSAIALLGTTVEKMAVEVRHLQRTEVREAEEHFAPGQKGSSAMPHKRNPIISERLSGQARILRGNMLAAFENVPLWHERDISHSSVERVILPDSTTLLHYMLRRAADLIDSLVVYSERMRENLQVSHGLVYSQKVLLALVSGGMLRDAAYRVVQRDAMKAWDEERAFLDVLSNDPEVTGVLNEEQLRECFDPGAQLRHLDEIFARVEELRW